jgi:hypothetical protein
MECGRPRPAQATRIVAFTNWAKSAWLMAMVERALAQCHLRFRRRLVVWEGAADVLNLWNWQ